MPEGCSISTLGLFSAGAPVGSGLGESDWILVGQIDDVMCAGSLKEVLIIKKSHYMLVMRSALWAHGWWLAEDPVLPGLQSRGLISWNVVFSFHRWSWLKVIFVWRQLFDFYWASAVEYNLNSHFNNVLGAYHFMHLKSNYGVNDAIEKHRKAVHPLSWRHAFEVKLLVCMEEGTK